jgi:hypothetical protein
MGKLLSYLNQDRKNDIKKVKILNKYFNNKYHLISSALSKMKNMNKIDMNSY